MRKNPQFSVYRRGGAGGRQQFGDTIVERDKIPVNFVAGIDRISGQGTGNRFKVRFGPQRCDTCDKKSRAAKLSPKILDAVLLVGNRR